MKKLFNSFKFWAITIGALLGCTMYYIMGDGEGLGNGFPAILIAAYSSIAILGKGEDITKAFKNNK